MSEYCSYNCVLREELLVTLSCNWQLLAFLRSLAIVWLLHRRSWPLHRDLIILWTSSNSGSALLFNFFDLFDLLLRSSSGEASSLVDPSQEFIACVADSWSNENLSNLSWRTSHNRYARSYCHLATCLMLNYWLRPGLVLVAVGGGVAKDTNKILRYENSQKYKPKNPSY